MSLWWEVFIFVFFVWKSVFDSIRQRSSGHDVFHIFLKKSDIPSLCIYWKRIEQDPTLGSRCFSLLLVSCQQIIYNHYVSIYSIFWMEFINSSPSLFVYPLIYRCVFYILHTLYIILSFFLTVYWVVVFAKDETLLSLCILTEVYLYTGLQW